MENKSATNSNKILDLSSFEIVLINYVEESKKGELFEGLKGLYGESEPVDAGVITGGATLRSSPDFILGKTGKFYDDSMALKKPLPDKFDSLEVSLVNHIPNWCEVICKGKLKEECLELAKLQFEERLQKEHTASTAKVFVEAHEELEKYLSPHIMDNIVYQSDPLNKQHYYTYLYLGRAGHSSLGHLWEANYTRFGMGWGLGLCFNIERRYLIQPIGGVVHIHQGGAFPRFGFSIFPLFHITEGAIPASWGEESKRRWARHLAGSGYDIVDTISLMLLTNIVLTHRLKIIKQYESIDSALSHSIKEQSKMLNKGCNNALQGIKALYEEMIASRAAFLGESFDLRNECESLGNIVKLSSDYLSARDKHNIAVEEVCYHPTDATKVEIENYLQNWGSPKGVLSYIIRDSELKKHDLISKLNKIEQEQIGLISHVNGFLDISLQTNMERLTKKMGEYTKWLVFLTFALVIFTILLIIYKK